MRAGITFRIASKSRHAPVIEDGSDHPCDALYQQKVNRENCARTLQGSCCAAGRMFTAVSVSFNVPSTCYPNLTARHWSAYPSGNMLGCWASCYPWHKQMLPQTGSRLTCYPRYPNLGHVTHNKTTPPTGRVKPVGNAAPQATRAAVAQAAAAAEPVAAHQASQAAGQPADQPAVQHAAAAASKAVYAPRSLMLAAAKRSGGIGTF